MKSARSAAQGGEKQNALINKLPLSAAIFPPPPLIEMHPTVRMKLKIKQHSGGETTRIESNPSGACSSGATKDHTNGAPIWRGETLLGSPGGWGGSALIYHSLGSLQSSRSVYPFRPGHHSIAYERLLHSELEL